MEVGEGGGPGGVEGGGAGDEGCGGFVEVGAQVVVSGVGAEENKLEVGCHGYDVEVEPVEAYGVEVVCEVVASGKAHERQQGHECLGMAEAEPDGGFPFG